MPPENGKQVECDAVTSVTRYWLFPTVMHGCFDQLCGFEGRGRRYADYRCAACRCAEPVCMALTMCQTLQRCSTHVIPVTHQNAFCILGVDFSAPADTFTKAGVDNNINIIGWQFAVNNSFDIDSLGYFDLNGNSLTGSPLINTPGTNNPDMAWDDLWFYSNPIFVKAL